MSNWKLAELFFLQIMTIMVVSRVVSLIGKKLYQPIVVCEMITGILIGPSLLGLIFPDLFAGLFPKESMTTIFSVAQLGLSLYMFTVGLQFDASLLRQKTKQALSISAAGILIPFAVAIPITLYLINSSDYFSAEMSTVLRCLFVGAAISITAFPMLARIIKECNLSETKIGTLVLSAAAGDDVISWCLLALITSSVKGTYQDFFMTILGGVFYVFVCFFIIAPLIRRLAIKYDQDKTSDTRSNYFVLILGLLMLGSWFTDKIGIYSVFGAFILGLSLPKGSYKRDMDHMLTPMTTIILLPMFFVYSGLNTRFDLIMDYQTLMAAAAVVIASILAKGFGCGFAAKWTGESLRNSLAIGALMNARGLMELILLNIGLQNNLITVKTYTIFVLMAIITTFMASPVFFILQRKGLKLD
jgi:Kef-type K+ transport system membrane component KefB